DHARPLLKLHNADCIGNFRLHALMESMVIDHKAHQLRDPARLFPLPVPAETGGTMALWRQPGVAAIVASLKAELFLLKHLLLMRQKRHHPSPARLFARSLNGSTIDTSITV